MHELEIEFCPSLDGYSLVMRPHPNDFHDPLAAEHLIDETMLNADPARERTDEIPDEFLKGRRRLKGIAAKDLEQQFGFGLETRPA